MSQFVNFHSYSHFSLLQSLISPKDLFLRAKELGHPAIGLADFGSLSGAWDALKASRETGVKLIIGCEFFFRDNNEDKEQKLRNIVLFAKSHIGYQNLLHLNKNGFDNSVMIMKKVFPVLDWKLIKQYSDELICLTGDAN